MWYNCLRLLWLFKWYFQYFISRKHFSLGKEVMVKDNKDINGFLVCRSHWIAVRKASLFCLKSRMVNSRSFLHPLKPPNFELCALSLFSSWSLNFYSFWVISFTLPSTLYLTLHTVSKIRIREKKSPMQTPILLSLPVPFKMLCFKKAP